MYSHNYDRDPRLSVSSSIGMPLTRRRPQLPALTYLEIDKAKSEDDPYHTRNGRASAASPTFPQPLGPPPPYSHSTQPHSWATTKSNGHDNHEPRRTSGDERDNVKNMVRQSLPSLSEALGEHRQGSYTSTASAVQPSIQPPAPSSPHLRHSYSTEAVQPHNAYTAHSSYQSASLRHDSGAPQPYHSADTYKSLQTPSQHTRPPLHVQTSQPPAQGEWTDRYGPSPQREQSSSLASGPRGPPSVPYGYASYSSGHGESLPPAGQSSGPIYQPSSQYGPPQPSPRWRSENAPSRYVAEESSAQPAPYGESVKRHLDLYDLEAALNDVR